ncbi:MAG: LPS-assembly protein LptD [Hyphomicrobiaceae bacterium]
MQGLTWNNARALKAAAVRGLLGLTVICALTTTISAQQTDNNLEPQIYGRPATKPGATGSGSPFPKTPQIDRAQPLYLQGDELIYDNKGGRVTARGNVEIYYNNYILTADEVVYDQRAGQLSAHGNVLLREPGGAKTTAERLVLSDDFRDGFVQSLSFVAQDDSKITARRATRRAGNITEFEKGKFTPCKSTPGAPPAWCISANRVIHDQEAQVIRYEDAAFELFGVPVLYVPYFEHADPTVKRKSGFLSPRFGTSGDLGYISEVAYFFNLAPNYDFTFHPTYTSKQGILWQGEFRHRIAVGSIAGQYRVKLAGIDQDIDDLPVSNARPDLDGWRGSIKTSGNFSLASWWNFGWDATIESDDSFRRFYKLDNILQTDRVNSVFLKGIGDRSYVGLTGYHFGGLLLSDQDVSESQVHPVFDWNYVVNAPVIGGELSWNVNALSFSRDQSFQDGAGEARDVNSITHRASADINWRRRFMDTIGISYTPFASLRGDASTYRDVVNPLDDNLVRDKTVLRGTAAAGILAAYPWIKHTANASHTISPIGQIIARSSRVGDQNALPNEDARSLVFDDTNLFEIDKHSGYDRLETGTRANVGLQYTFQLNTGGYARILAGQSFLLSGRNNYADIIGNEPTNDTSGNRNISHTGDAGLDTARSDYVIGGYVAPTTNLRFIGQARFNETDLNLRRSDFYATASYGPFVAQASYSFTAPDSSVDDTSPQQDVLGSLWIQFTDRWSIGGMLRYDIDEKEIRQDALSLRYADECYVLTTSYRNTNIIDSDNGITKDQTFMVRLEFKHLGGFNYKTDSLDFNQAVNQ